VPTVAGVQLNDGHAQRSMVNRITITFSGAVTLAPGAFELRKGNGRRIDLMVSQSVVNGRTMAVLTFTGPRIIGGSLRNGRYTLIIHGERIHDAFGQAVDGDNDGIAGGAALTEFFRRFGDTDGDRDVDRRDRRTFRNARRSVLGDLNYLWYLDYNQDGDIDRWDAKRFRSAFIPPRSVGAGTPSPPAGWHAWPGR
jgi:hypothetical protein